MVAMVAIGKDRKCIERQACFAHELPRDLFQCKQKKNR